MPAGVPRPLLVVTAILLLLRLAAGLVEVREARRWRSSPAWSAATLLEEERQPERPLLLVFGAHWCRPCKRLMREVFADESTLATVEELALPIRIEDGLAGDGLSDEQAEALRDRFGVEAFPTLIVVRDGKVLGRTSGFSSRERTLDWLRASVGTAAR